MTIKSLYSPLAPLAPQNDERISDDRTHELDKVILAQSVEQESAAAGREDRREQGTEEQEPDDGNAKKDGEVKVEPTVQQVEEEGIETVRTDQEEIKPAQDLESEIDSKKTIEKAKSGGDQEMKSEDAEGKEDDKDSTLVVVEKAAVQDPSPIPSLGSKIEKETVVATKPEAVESIDGQGNEDDKPLSPQVSKPDKLLPTESSSKKKGAEDPSNQELNKLKPSQYHPDPVSSPSHPLKPLPNIDDGITETKSEPRLPLLPPIGSKKITALQTSSGVLKSNSTTGIAASVATTKEQPKGPSTEKRKDGRESAPSSDQASSTKRKKKSTDSLRSTSGSSISKSKKSSGSNSTVSLGQKSKSRESLRSGPQNRLSTTASKSSDNLASGAAKKLSISKESLKAASQVYSSVPAPKSGGGELPVRKGDSGKSQSSRNKEAAVKAEKERKSSDQKPPEKEMVEGTDSKVKDKEDTAKSSTNEKKEGGDCLNQDDTATKEPDSNTKTAELPPTSTEEQATVISTDQPAKKEKTNEVVVTVSEPEEKVNKDDQTSADASPKEETDESTKTDKATCGGDGGERSDAKEAKDETSATAEPTSTSVSVSSTEKEQVKAQDQIEDSPPPKPTKEKAKTEEERESSEAPAPSTPAKVDEVPTTSSVPPTSVEVKSEDTKIKAKDDTSETTKTQEQAKEAVSKLPPPMDLKESPAAGTAAGETTSQTVSSEFACKLEIDKKTGQSEQSIVEAVEKSTEPVIKTRDVSTPA